MKFNIHKMLIPIVCACFSSCASNYVEPSVKSPHATLEFEKATGLGSILGGQNVAPLEINSKTPSEWKWTHRRFRIPVGQNSMHVHTLGGRLTASTPMRFNARQGETYNVYAKSSLDYYTFFVKDGNGKVITSKKASKQPRVNTSNYVPIFIPVN